MSLTLIPAYGRDYKSVKSVKTDWEDGKNFKISDVSSHWNGTYTSIRDNHDEVKILYSNNTKAVIIRGTK